MKLSIFNKAFRLAEKRGFNYDYNEIELNEVEEIYEEAMEFLFEELEPVKLDSSEISGDSRNVTFALPLGQVTVSGEFEYDKEREVFKHLGQDVDGQTYLIEW